MAFQEFANRRSIWSGHSPRSLSISLSNTTNKPPLEKRMRSNSIHIPRPRMRQFPRNQIGKNFVLPLSHLACKIFNISWPKRRQLQKIDHKSQIASNISCGEQTRHNTAKGCAKKLVRTLSLHAFKGRKLGEETVQRTGRTRTALAR